MRLTDKMNLARAGLSFCVAGVLLLAPASRQALAIEMCFAPEVPADLPGADTVLPWMLVRTDTAVPGTYALEMTLPRNTHVDGLHVVSSAEMLFSVEGNPVELESSGEWYGQGDVVRFDLRQPPGSQISPFLCASSTGLFGLGVNIDALSVTPTGNLVVSFDAPTTLGSRTHAPADLVELASTGPGCGSWTVVGSYFDSNAAGIPPGVDVTGASLDPTSGYLILTFDVPPRLAFTFLPGTLVQWDGFSLSTFANDPNWPLGVVINAFSIAPSCVGIPPTGTVGNALRAVAAGGNVELSWPATGVVPPDFVVFKAIARRELVDTPVGIGNESRLGLTTATTLTVPTSPGGNGIEFYEVFPIDSCGRPVLP